MRYYCHTHGSSCEGNRGTCATVRPKPLTRPQDSLDILPAIRMAVEVHGGQKDKSGEPYLFHVFRVAMAMKTDHERVVAFLHDVMEDGGMQWLDTIRVEYGDEIASSVLNLTHKKNLPYSEYIRGLPVDPLAVRVKIADLMDNMRAERLRKLPPPEMGRLVNKYAPALQFLEGLAS